MSELSELLRSSLPDGWSARRVAREARALGFDLSDASATAYLGGRHGTPDDATVMAFVAALRISEDRVRAAAGLSPVGDEWLPPASARYLTASQRRALNALISSMTEREENDRGNTAAKNRAGDGPATPRAVEAETTTAQGRAKTRPRD